MDDNPNVKENLSDINDNFEIDLDMQKLKDELRKSFSNYQKTMRFMLADAPIEALCLPHATEKILLDSGFLRIYDLFDVDLVKIKGFGVARSRQLTSSLDKFLAML